MKPIALALAVVAASTGLYAQTHNHVTVKLSEAQWGPAPPFHPGRCTARGAVGRSDQAGPVLGSLEVSRELRDSSAFAPDGRERRRRVRCGDIRRRRQTGVKGSSNTTIGVGGYMLATAGMNHFAYTGATEATIVLYGIGPVDFKYVNPADDPRNVKSSTR